jgi:diguanylate cyclase (GGDEF)-like protein
MHFLWTPYAIPFLVSTLLCGALAMHVSRHRDSSAAPPFVLLLASITAWMFLEGLMVLGTDVATKYRLAWACYPGVVMIGPSLLMVALRAGEYDRKIAWPILTLMLAVPVGTAFVLAFDSVPGLLFRTFEIDASGAYPVRDIDRGPWYYVIIAHTYLQVGIASYLFLKRATRDWHELGVDGPVIFLGISIPWITTTLNLLGFELFPRIGSVPMGFMISAMCLAWGLERSGLLGVIGIGRRMVVDAMGEAVLVVDRRLRLIDLNESARRIFDLGDAPVTGEFLDTVLVAKPHVVETVSAALAAHPYGKLPRQGQNAGEIELDEGGDVHSYAARVSPLTDRRGREISNVFVFTETTERRLVEAELARESGYIRLIQDVAVAANEASIVEEALEGALSRIAEAMDWAVGVVYLPAADGTGDLVATDNPHAPTGGRFDALLKNAAYQRISTGSGMIARVFESGNPELADIARNFHNETIRRDFQDRFGLRTAIAMPVTAGTRTAAVMGFAATEEVESHDEMLRVLSHLGGILGRVIERKMTEARIRDLAYFDPLTGLANRQLFRQRLETALAQGRRRERMVGLLFVDLDRFKVINDTLGHSTGDAVLMQVSERFAASVRLSDVVCRDSDENPASISRLGGDEFTVLLTALDSAEDAAIVGRRLIASLEAPFTVGDHEVFTGASIGIALSPTDGVDAETLLKNADAAMYDAKSRGANRFEFYSSVMNRESERRLQLENRLRRALECEGLDVAYQPQRDARTGEVLGVEALLRWNDPEHGQVPPSEFIPIAERTGLIVPLGAWVLGRACEQARSWQLAGYRPVRMGVNVSGHQIRMSDFPETVRCTLLATGLSPEWLELELTESAIEGDDPATQDALNALRELGVNLALDDFGTGTSSLTHLRQFPMGRVKIDRSFVQGLPDDSGDVALTNAIIAMAHGMKCDVVAEGVETEPQALFLADQGCDLLQGYLISRPISAKEVVRFLELEKLESEDA